jgi:hypothetical protein
VLGLLLLALLAACSSTGVEHETVASPHFTAADGAYTLELPLGWRQAENALTFEGPDHQTITFNSGPVLDTNEGVPIDASAPDLLTAMRDSLEAQPGIELLECRTTTLDGLSGFRMHFRPLSDEGAPAEAQRAEVVIYCAIEGATLYALSLESRDPATRVRDLEVFERLVASFRRAQR